MIPEDSKRLARLEDAAIAYTACLDIMQVIALQPDKLIRAIEALGHFDEALIELAETVDENRRGQVGGYPR